MTVLPPAPPAPQSVPQPPIPVGPPPAAKGGHRVRNVLLIVVVVVIGLAALGSLTGGGKSSSPAGNGGTSAPDLSGTVVFGATVDTSAFTVATPVQSASLSTPLGWVAYLTDSAKGTSVTLTLARVATGGGETSVESVPVSIANPADNELAHAPDDSLAAYGAGTFTLRYIRPSDGVVLATGTIKLAP